ncbi:MAG: hypothetical protein ACTSVP_08540, partial [Candidatus Heimdallarchaeota archaeon]
MLDQPIQNSSSLPKTENNLLVLKNKKSTLNETVLVDHKPEKCSFSMHVYGIILPSNNYISSGGGSVIDLRSKKNAPKNPFKIIGEQKKGSLYFTRYFVKNPAEKKYMDKLKEKYPGKKTIRAKKYFSPLLLLLAHFTDQVFYSETATEEEIQEIMQESLIEFEDYIKDEIHQILRTVGKPFYLKGEKVLLNYHQIREIPETLLKKITDEKLLLPITKQQQFTSLIPIVKDTRREATRQTPLLSSYTNPSAISHIVSSNNQFLPLNDETFPIIVVGEPDARKNVILNMIKNANAKFLILDPGEEYGRIANSNSRVRGYLLGENFFLNIISTEGDNIREQVYAFWFGKIISYIANLNPQIAKTLETYLLGAFRDPTNANKTEIQFRSFANQELTSEVTKIGRNESSTVSNTLYPLGTYDEISILTRVGRSFSFDSLFETKGAIIQYAQDDEQLSRISYLFTTLKLRTIQDDDHKMLVLENLDDFIGKGIKSWQDNGLSELILGLSTKYRLIIGVRSPSKINEIFKNTKVKIINRLSMMEDQRLFEKEYSISKKDSFYMNKLSEREFYVLSPEFSAPKLLKVDLEPAANMRVKVDKLEKDSSVRILESENHLRRDGIPPEIQKTIFEIIKVLREKPRKVIPEEGFEKLIANCSEVDILRAKEIAREESFIKIIEKTTDESEESLNLILLTERGEEYYQGYLDLQKDIPHISLKSLAQEKNFERDVFTQLEEANKLFQAEKNDQAVEHLIKIAVKILAILPEEDRFISGKLAAQLVDHWSYLSSLKEANNESKGKKLYSEFSQVVINSMKAIMNQVLSQRKELKELTASETENTKQKQKPAKRKNPVKVAEGEYEFNFNELENPDVKVEQVDPWEKQIEFAQSRKAIKVSESPETTLKEEDSNSKFLAASDDLRSAGLSHIDANGAIYKPKKTPKKKNDPFTSKETGDASVTKQQLKEVQKIKSSLMTKIAK